VVLGALYMLWFAQRFLFGATRLPAVHAGHGHGAQAVTDLGVRERAILLVLVASIFALGLFPDEPMRKTELAARQYQQLVSTPRTANVAVTEPKVAR
jgi:NADH-quinone oxidoreductase subunit M